MTGKIIRINFFVLCLMMQGGNAEAQATDKMKIEQAIKDYVYAIYEADTMKVYKSVDVHQAKRGSYKKQGNLVEATMSFPQLVVTAKTWLTPQRNLLKPEITIFDILDITASAKVVASWGIDYFHLSKISGEWKIYNVMWQMHPEKK